MYAMQYEITLPADYDMDIIRRRVETKGSELDDFPGLGLKAYLMRERGVNSPVNQYAPFYLWASTDQMRNFLLGEGFRGLCADFGRPAVRHCLGVTCLRGPDGSTPRAATRRITALPDDLTGERRALDELAASPDVHTAALAVDPRTWELVRFTLWAEDAPDDAAYQVLHLSSPHLTDIADRKQ